MKNYYGIGYDDLCGERAIDDFAKALDEKFGFYAIHGILYPCREILEKADRARFYELFYQWMETGEVQIVGEVKPELTKVDFDNYLDGGPETIEFLGKEYLLSYLFEKVDWDRYSSMLEDWIKREEKE